MLPLYKLNTEYPYGIEYESKRKMFFVIYFALNHGFATQIPPILEYIEKLFQDKDDE